MNNKIVAKRIYALAEEIMADEDYVYDPRHINHPHGGGNWHKTEKGWSRKQIEKGGIPEKEIDIQNSNLSKDVMKELSDHENEQVRIDVALNSGATPEILEKLSDDQEIYVRSAVARNKNTSGKTLNKLSQDPEMYVREEVSKNPNTPVETLKNLAESGELFIIRGVLKNPSATSDILDGLSRYKDDSSHSQEEWIRKGVIEHPNTSDQTLQRLVNDEYAEIRKKAKKKLSERGKVTNDSVSEKEIPSKKKTTSSPEKTRFFKKNEEDWFEKNNFEKMESGNTYDAFSGSLNGNKVMIRAFNPNSYDGDPEEYNGNYEIFVRPPSGGMSTSSGNSLNEVLNNVKSLLNKKS